MYFLRRVTAILLQQKNFGPNVIYIVLESCKLDTGGLYPARPRANKTRVGTEGRNSGAGVGEGTGGPSILIDNHIKSFKNHIQST